MSGTYTVKRNDKVGRYVLAAKDLKAGEEMLVEWPVAVGPKASSPAVCLGCYCPWPSGEGEGAVCEDCGWPVCGPECAQQPLHKDSECAVFAAAGVRFNAEAENEFTGTASPQFECITPLRMLLAKDKQAERWEAEVAEMEAHTEARKAEPDWATEHINVVEFLRRKCRLTDRFSEDIIHWAIGVLEVNAFEVRTDDGYFIRGLYPQTAIMSHSCVANTTHTIYPAEHFRSQVRTTIDVPEGGELFASYTSSIQPTILRRENIKYSKYFDCDCPRCTDPTELGTHLSSLKCTKCDNGVITSSNSLGSYIPYSDPTELGTHLSSLKCTKCDNGVITSSNSLDNDAAWNCSHCEFSIRADTVKKIFNMIQGEIEQIEHIEGFDIKIQEAEKLLKKFKSVLHPRHVYLTSLRHSLLQLYGRAPSYTFFDLPDILLERKIELCRQVLEVVDVVKPGMNRFRGLILYELHVPLMLFNRNRYEYKELTKEEFKKLMEEVVQILQDAVNILCLEDPRSPEGKIGIVGKDSMEQLKASIDQL